MNIEIRPLFKLNDYSGANEFLTNKFTSNGQIRFISLQENIDNIKPPANFISHMIKELYGVNQPQMANFFIVQEFVDLKLRNRLFNYLKNSSVEFEIVDFIPGAIASQLIFSRMNNGEYTPPLEYWNPDNPWNFDEIHDPKMELISPLNGFVHMELTLKNIKNSKDFIMTLARNGIINDSSNINQDIVPELRLKLLPYNNFNKVMNIANSIFKYL